MTKLQYKAIGSPVRAPDGSKENTDLQDAWNHPIRVKINGAKNWCLVIAVILLPDGSYEWMASTRIENSIKKHFKPRDQWTLDERLRSHELLKKLLKDVGNDSTVTDETFELGSIMRKKLSAYELSAILKPHLLGTMGEHTNGHDDRSIHEGGSAVDEEAEHPSDGEDEGVIEIPEQ